MIYKNTTLPVELKAGDVIMFRNEFEITHPITILSGAIRHFTDFVYNHVGVVVENNGDLFINEALAGGITARPLEKFLERGNHSYIAVLRPKKGIDDPIAFSRNANVHVGSKYDFTSLVFHHTVYRIPKLLGATEYGKWVGSTGEFAASKLVCSEYVALVYGMPYWWLASTREVYESGVFELIFEEKKFLQ
jgi:hypothetical protein